ncbi:hypothetical protein HELRODRAFT_70089 [Helobdella robusta]|uniref:RING-type domain-containing protein n=1 Tax=Helobdella robusta TaxID=6412 RepID=T1G026_HELRO|nr:hypothetical protein HELRODRAFT_70089 [Helobdella robusta]ESN91550.1 hypothetical protein HELRODRAFT_70089 [Helobdella robusta]
MGLCKCPKKKVTTLFCFEHTVNVCEHCLVSDHPRCIVQSYLRWLQDSDYDPTCRLCGKNLADDSCGPCVRLVCYDVFHWSCLNNYENSLPANTAPAGYTCPLCSVCVFPPSNASSPVIDELVKLLSTVNWARAGLGLPLIEERQLTQDKPQLMIAQNGSLSNSLPPPLPLSAPHMNSTSPLPAYIASSYQLQSTSASPATSNMTSSTLSKVDDSIPYPRIVEKNDLFLSGYHITHFFLLEYLLLIQKFDHDMDKYKRRPAMQWFSRWLRYQHGGRLRTQPSSKIKRYTIMLFIFLIAFVTIVLIFNELGKHSTEDDPLLDPMANPNIRVQQ